MSAFKHKPASQHEPHESRAKGLIGSQKKDRTNSFGKAIFGPGSPIEAIVRLIDRCTLGRKMRRQM